MRQDAKKGPVPLGSPGNRSPESRWFRFGVWLVLGLTFFYYLYRLGSLSTSGIPQEISYGEFYQWLSSEPSAHKIREAIRTENIIRGETEDGRRFIVNIPENDPDVMRLLRDRVPHFRLEPPRTFWLSFFFNLAGPLLFLGVF